MGRLARQLVGFVVLLLCWNVSCLLAEEKGEKAYFRNIFVPLVSMERIVEDTSDTGKQVELEIECKDSTILVNAKGQKEDGSKWMIHKESQGQELILSVLGVKYLVKCKK